VRLEKLKKNRGRGSANALVQVSGPGSLTLTGKGISKTTATSKGAGIVKLTVTPTGVTKKLLAKNGKAKVHATIAFTPAGGGVAVTAPATIDLVKRPRRSGFVADG
jgi:hypothetical protein